MKQIADDLYLLRGFPPNAIPSTIILDRRGRVAEVHLGTMLRGDIEPVLTRLAAEL